MTLAGNECPGVVQIREVIGDRSTPTLIMTGPLLPSDHGRTLLVKSAIVQDIGRRTLTLPL